MPVVIGNSAQAGPRRKSVPRANVLAPAKNHDLPAEMQGAGTGLGTNPALQFTAAVNGWLDSFSQQHGPPFLQGLETLVSYDFHVQHEHLVFAQHASRHASAVAVGKFASDTI